MAKARHRVVKDSAYWMAKDLMDIETYLLCFTALGGGL